MAHGSQPVKPCHCSGQFVTARRLRILDTVRTIPQAWTHAPGIAVLMTAPFDIHPPTSDAEIDAYAEILRASFCTPIEQARMSIDRVGMRNILLVRRHKQVLGGLYLLPMGQWFGGRSVPTLGIAAVGIAPEHRGGGAARALMDRAVEEARQRGIPLSTLYPATHTLYRRSGYELAGSHHAIRIYPARVPVLDRHASMRPLAHPEASVVEDVYRRVACEQTGWLDRSAYMWRRIAEPLEVVPHAMLVLDGDAPVGYCYYLLERKDVHTQHMRIIDMSASTVSAARRLLTFFADHRSLTHEVTWHGPANDPMLMLLPERAYDIHVAVDWMLRLVNVPAALTLRGYAAGIEAELHWEITDALAAEPVSRYVLSVAGGVGQVSAGGEGRLACDVRGLAAMYTGFMSPAQLVRSGMLRGEPNDLATAAAVFAGGPPSMVDIF